MPRLNRHVATLVAGVSVLGIAGAFTIIDAGPGGARYGAETQPDYRLTSVNIDDSQLTLAWNGEADKYRVRIGTSLKKPLLDTTTSDPTATLNTLGTRVSRSATLRYRIENISASDSETVLDGVITLPPDTVTKPTLKRVESNGLVLAWDPVPRVTNYDVSFSTDKDTEPFAIHRIDAPESRFVTDALKPGTTGYVRVRAVREGGLGEFREPVKYDTPAEFSEFAVGAWNVCSEACLGYGSRSGAQAAKVQESNMDIMTLQEAGGQRVGRTTNAAFSGGERGFVRAFGGAETRYIFFREELFKQEDGGRFSVGHDRTVTWARLLDRKTETTFVVASVHLSPGKNSKRDAIRGSQSSRLVSAINSIGRDGEPVILAGDFNSGRHRGGDRVFGHLTRGGFKDAVEIAGETDGASQNSFNRGSANSLNSGDHVDHIFVNDGVGVPLWRMYNHLRGGKVLTDHNMIAAKVRISGNVSKIDKPSKSVVLPLNATQVTAVAPEPTKPESTP